VKDDLGKLCALLFACEGKAYSFRRLKIVIYALSEGSKETLNLPKIFSYKFDGNDFAGPDDDDLRDDLQWLNDAGYILAKKTSLEKCSEHTLYELTEKGKEIGIIAFSQLDEESKKALFKISNDLKNLPEYPVAKLLEKYAPNWEKIQLEILRKS